MIEAVWDNPEMMACRDYFNMNLPDNFYLSHYELADQSTFPAFWWKNFLTDPYVSDYVVQELRMLKQFEIQKILKDISGKSRSVGVAQTLGALMKNSESDNKKKGPAFIYGYIPINAKEAQAANVHTLEYDPFKLTE